jgi:uncharacterized protein YndB with AHSA1/START domain
VFINCKVRDAWDALVDGDQTEQYYYGTRVESDWGEGSELRYLYPDGSVAADGQVLAIDPPKRLELTFHPRWDPEIDAAGPVRMVWLVDDASGATRLTVELYQLEEGSHTFNEFVGGIPFIVSGLKTLLETGKPMMAVAGR